MITSRVSFFNYIFFVYFCNRRLLVPQMSKIMLGEVGENSESEVQFPCTFSTKILISNTPCDEKGSPRELGSDYERNREIC